MSDVAIRVDHLSKEFRIGKSRGKFRYKSLRDSVSNAMMAPLRRAASMVRGNAYGASELEESFWALKDVSFEVKQGEAVGVIGRNGAGKSTLLKILSEITEPSEGTVELYGRVGSLLEVGTGFHPELTGRDNIYLNGAILGMKRAEINRQFDAIVDFAEVEKFIDTPVKHYSSGMYVRLAFAVAAHLEPEILVVDEVLAVGDAEFQKKCLGKMGDVAKGGRTVLFVSHNLQALQSFCETSILLEHGRLESIGPTKTIVTNYLSATNNLMSSMKWPRENAPGNKEIKLVEISVHSTEQNLSGTFSSQDDLYVDMKFLADIDNPGLIIGFDLVTPDGFTILRSDHNDSIIDQTPPVVRGLNHWQCTIPSGLLNAGSYGISPKIGILNAYWIINLDAVINFEVVLGHGVSPSWAAWSSRNRRPGIIAPILSWTVRDHQEGRAE